MPRQRKPQNGGQRIWTGRVANTTTGSTTTQTVYRIPTGKRYGECDVLNYEVVWTAPIRVAIEWSNVYRVSLDEAALKNIIENYDNLDLSNVTLQTVNWDVTFEWKVTWNEFEWTAITAETISATSWDITNITSENVDADNIEADTSSLWAASADTLKAGVLTVSWASTFDWAVTMNDTLDVVGDTTMAKATITEWDIATLSSDNAEIETLAVTNGLTVTGWEHTDTITVGWNASVWGGLSVTWATSLTTLNTSDQAVLNSLIVNNNAVVRWATSTDTLNVNGTSSFGGNATFVGNVSVAWNQTVNGNGIFSNDISVAGDASIADDLSVTGWTHLSHAETTGSVAVGWSLRVTWAIDWANWASITGQLEADTARVWEIVSDEVRVNEWLYLTSWAVAPDFILQDEKGEAGGVAPLNACGKIDTQYLPNLWTAAWMKVWYWSFDNSNTAIINDEDITNDAFVDVSNYQDIIWDTEEIISEWKLTVISNKTETGSFKYIVVKPFSWQSGCECA